MLVRLMGSFQQSVQGVIASRVINSITYTAKTMGLAGNSITIALVAGGTAGSEVVTVTGTAISVSIESGVSTRTQVKSAIDASAAAALLISVSVSSGGTAATASSVLPLQSGADSTFAQVGGSGMTLTQIDTGIYKITLSDPYAALLDANISLQAASAVDRISQLQSVDVVTAKSIVFRMQAAATPGNLSIGDILYIALDLRNSSQPASS